MRGSGGCGCIVFDSVASDWPGPGLAAGGRGLRGGMAGTAEAFGGRSGLGLTTAADGTPSPAADVGDL